MKAIITNESKERLIPKCCQECKQQICNEDGMIITPIRVANEMSETVTKCYKLEEEDNNPSPLEAIRMIEHHVEQVLGQTDDGVIEDSLEELKKELIPIKQDLTNYANMVESLEGLVEKYKKVINKELSILPGSIDHAQQIVLKEFVIADITKVLEGEK